jgi:hypothetical protein
LRAPIPGHAAASLPRLCSAPREHDWISRRQNAFYVCLGQILHCCVASGVRNGLGPRGLNFNSSRGDHRQREQGADDILPRVNHLRDPQIHTEAGRHVGVLPREVVLLGEVVDHWARGADGVLGCGVEVKPDSRVPYQPPVPPADSPASGLALMHRCET